MNRSFCYAAGTLSLATVKFLLRFGVVSKFMSVLVHDETLSTRICTEGNATSKFVGLDVHQHNIACTALSRVPSAALSRRITRVDWITAVTLLI